MTTTDHSGEQLTRRQLRELRLTGQTPVVADEAAVEDNAPADPVPPRRDAPVNNPLPRPAEPIVVAAPETPAAPSAGATEHRLTRRELRDLERVRTASVPVIRPADDAADPAAAAADIAPAVEPAVLAEAEEPVAAVDAAEASRAADSSADEAKEASAEEEHAPVADNAVSAEVAAQEPAADGTAADHIVDEQSDAGAADAGAAAPDASAPTDHVSAPVTEHARPAWAPPAETASPAPAFDAPLKAKTPEKGTAEHAAVSDGPTLSSSFGAQVAPGPSSGEQSFDELISRDSGGSTAAGHSLVLPDATLPPLTAPVTSTGAMLVTGTFNLPELGSQGHAPGVADGKDVDAVLIDGELPAASSPTPIAATAAVSQAKAPGEIIKPPVPEKSNKLMLVLAITAGVLALALVGVIVGAALTGMMQ
ncbi:hypothetical protein [Microbacterium nymphoidis]|uniref:hypothetical protein n=1 Tax=Microbacterium nymphoidis TaxID=2898586 RepID=UPI001E4153C3|nr:hypothetical protein [Microbacterium nymphoidis]MCD2497247.1 hypothetical protein [Microbacterium nymphoidis]